MSLPRQAPTPEQSRFPELCGYAIVVGAVALAVVRFLGESPLSRNAEAFLASVALGVVFAAPGALSLVAARTGRTVLLLGSAMALAPLSLVSIATILLLVISVALAVAWVRRPPTGHRLRALASVLVAVVGCIGALLLLVLRTTTRTFTDGNTAASTDGWVPWTTSIEVVGLVIVTVASATWLAPTNRSRPRSRERLEVESL